MGLTSATLGRIACLAVALCVLLCVSHAIAQTGVANSSTELHQNAEGRTPALKVLQGVVDMGEEVKVGVPQPQERTYLPLFSRRRRWAPSGFSITQKIVGFSAAVVAFLIFLCAQRAFRMNDGNSRSLASGRQSSCVPGDDVDSHSAVGAGAAWETASRKRKKRRQKAIPPEQRAPDVEIIEELKALAEYIKTAVPQLPQLARFSLIAHSVRFFLQELAALSGVLPREAFGGPSGFQPFNDLSELLDRVDGGRAAAEEKEAFAGLRSIFEMLQRLDVASEESSPYMSDVAQSVSISSTVAAQQVHAIVTKCVAVSKSQERGVLVAVGRELGKLGRINDTRLRHILSNPVSAYPLVVAQSRKAPGLLFTSKDVLRFRKSDVKGEEEIQELFRVFEESSELEEGQTGGATQQQSQPTHPQGGGQHSAESAAPGTATEAATVDAVQAETQTDEGASKPATTHTRGSGQSMQLSRLRVSAAPGSLRTLWGGPGSDAAEGGARSGLFVSGELSEQPGTSQTVWWSQSNSGDQQGADLYPMTGVLSSDEGSSDLSQGPDEEEYVRARRFLASLRIYGQSGNQQSPDLSPAGTPLFGGFTQASSGGEEES